MSYTVNLSPKAEKEFFDAIQWYEAEQQDLGERFEGEVLKKIALIQNDPLHYAIKKGLREARTDTFPYLLIYKTEDMFSRLNEAVPLNSAEKRNAFGGDMVDEIRKLSKHPFFASKVKFGNNRYQHYEAAARLLLIEVSTEEGGKIYDTKKVYLDSMTKNYRSGHMNIINRVSSAVTHYLDIMNNCFTLYDNLLRAQGNITVYYLLFKWAEEAHFTITRSQLLTFMESVKANREVAEAHYEIADFDLLEYDRLTQQGTNDASNIKERLRIITECIRAL